MNHSLFVGKYAGIPVKIHWSFGFMFFFILFLGEANGLSEIQMVWFTLYILVLFLCVILHEYGHALMARKFDVETIDIIISPIGGLARLKNIPDNPIQELLIAFAGPAVNVIIAFILAIVIMVGYGMNPLDIQENFNRIHIFSEFLKLVFLINVALFVFNLIPAFPMDGGRILRALLAIKLGRYQATKIASWIGKFLAVAFVLLAIYWQHLLLGIIGVFIFSMANAEFKQVSLTNKMLQTTISIITAIKYPTVQLQDTMAIAIDKFKNSEIKNLLVLDEGENAVGVLPYQFIIDAEKNSKQDIVVSAYASRNLKLVDEDSSVMETKDSYGGGRIKPSCNNKKRPTIWNS